MTTPTTNGLDQTACDLAVLADLKRRRLLSDAELASRCDACGVDSEALSDHVERLDAISPTQESKPTMAQDSNLDTDLERRRMTFKLHNAWRGESNTTLETRFDALEGNGEPDADADAARQAMGRRLHTAHARPIGQTSLTAEQTAARTDAADAGADSDQCRAVYLRVARVVCRTDAKSSKPQSAEKRALDRLQAIFDSAAGGTLTSSQTKEAIRLLETLSELHESAPDDTDTTANTDAADPEATALAKAQARANWRLHNRWRFNEDQIRKIDQDMAVRDLDPDDAA